MAAFKPYLPQRFVHPGPIVLFYPYGNYPADDLLEHVHFEDEREPAILELGCGDIGSCLYTLWKHFDSAASGRHFFGAQFFLNDKSGASLARNILFLYLAVKIPPWTELESAKQWIASMWAIWYCHELLPAHEQLLREALDALLSFSGTVESWKSSAENPLRKVVRLTDQLTLNKITAAWRLWRTFSFGSVQEVQKHRYSKVPHIGEDNMSPCVMSISPWLQATHGPTVTAVMYEAMNHEYTRYIETGNVFAEPCLDLPCIDHQSIVNPTLFEREDKIYSLDFTCLPFENFHHGFVVSKAIFQKAGLSLNAAGQPLVIEDDSFEQSPMLSNCIQQFSIWVSSTAVTLNSSSLSANPSVAFTLNCSECIHFCEEVQHNPQQFYRRTGIKPAFDAIYTSNLIDKLTPPVLVTAAAPLLKKNGCLLTTPFLYRCCAASAEEYLQDTFGFSPEYLPLIAGVRCIGHDGRYFSGTSALPTPVYGIESVLADFQCSRYDKLLIWQKVDAWPLKVPATGISVKTAICQTLHRSLRNASRRFYGKYPTIQGYHTRAALCTETALMNVLSFVSRLDAEVDITSYLFWEGLCSLLKEDTSLKPFLSQIQTLSLLHGLHFHVLVDTTNCPVCLKQPLKKAITHYTLEINQYRIKRFAQYNVTYGDVPAFFVIVHKVPISQRIHSIDNHYKTDHVVDSTQGQVMSGKLGENIKLDFYFLNSLLSDDYLVSVFRYITWPDSAAPSGENVLTVVPSAVHTWSLDEVQVQPFSEYSFKQAGANRAKGAYSGLGSVLDHFGEPEGMETTLLLSPKALTAAKAKNVCIKMVSPYSVDVYCGKQHLVIQYPYPIEHAHSKYHVYEDKRALGFVIPRGRYKFYEERPLFFINPNHKMALPALGVNADNLRSLCSMQFAQSDSNLFNKPREKRTAIQPLFNVKEAISLIFQHTQFSVYEFCQPSDHNKLLGAVVVNKRAVDGLRRTAIVDVSYLIVDPHTFRVIVQQWETMMQEVQIMRGGMQIPLYESEWNILKKVLQYFTSRTLPGGGKHHSPLLKKHSLEKHHTRAVLYPLYCDQDGVSSMLQDMREDIYPKLLRAYHQGVATNSTTLTNPAWGQSSSTAVPAAQKAMSSVGNTDLTSSTSSNSSKTLTLQSASSTSAQPSVKSTTSAAANTTAPDRNLCHNCGTKSDKLKKCTRCGKTWYCGKECQIKHWKEHKTVCRPPSGQPTVTKQPVVELPTKCSNCGKETSFLKRCGGCQLAAYCTKECQRNDWARHKITCTAQI